MDMVGGLMGGGGQDPKAALLQAAIGMIQNHPGGLQGLLGQFQQAGLGEHVASWVGAGENQPIGAEHVQQALGADQLAAFAQQAGLPQDQAASGLASMLPDLINHLTPSGALPQQDQMQGLLGGVLGKLLG
jgi:uncharacterized protein YidB (DUF937 family)